jgi:hypothetical protein
MSLSSIGNEAELHDPVTRFLHARDHRTEVAYLGETEFELGRRVVLGELDLVFRFEAGVLLLCHVEARDRATSLRGALKRLIALVHAVDASVPEVLEVCGLIPLRGEEAAEAELHRRLQAAYVSQGAEYRPDEDDDGSMARMVYRTRSGGRDANQTGGGRQ